MTEYQNHNIKMTIKDLFIKTVLYLIFLGLIGAVIVCFSGCSSKEYPNYGKKFKVCEDGKLYENEKWKSKTLIGEC